MHAMILSHPRAPLEWTELPDPQARARRNPRAGRGLRRLPHGPACRGRRIAGSRSCRSFPATRSSAGSMRSGAGVEALAARASASAFPGSGTPAASAPIAAAAAENLCDRPLFTGYTRDGGFATATIADARYAFPLGEDGERRGARAVALRRPDRLALAGDGRRGQEAGSLWLRRRGPHHRAGREVAGAIGVRLHPAGRYAHPGFRREAWARPGPAARTRRRRSRSMPRSSLRRSGDLVPLALKAVRKGGRVVCAGIHMSDIPSFPYGLLWEERQLVSVANLTRAGRHGFPAPGAARSASSRRPRPIRCARPTEALADLRAGRFDGAAVLVP